MITDWIFAIAALVGAIGTLLGTLGYRKRGKKLSAVSTALEDAGRRVVDTEEIIRALVIAVEKFRTDIKNGRYGDAVKDDLPDIARLIQTFAEELGVEADLSGYVQKNTREKE